MVSEIRIYLEGGGDSTHQKAKLRRAFTLFLGEIAEKCRPEKIPFRVIASGGRQKAYDSYVEAVSRSHSDAFNILLVDSESQVNSGMSVWQHLKKREGDGWNQVGTDDQCQLMAQTMETWLITDKANLKKYYGQGFRESALPNHANLENAPKTDVYHGLKGATRATQKGEFRKIDHGCPLLESTDPDLAKSLAHCHRLFVLLHGLV